VIEKTLYSRETPDSNFPLFKFTMNSIPYYII